MISAGNIELNFEQKFLEHAQSLMRQIDQVSRQQLINGFVKKRQHGCERSVATVDTILDTLHRDVRSDQLLFGLPTFLLAELEFLLTLPKHFFELFDFFLCPRACALAEVVELMVILSDRSTEITF